MRQLDRRGLYRGFTRLAALALAVPALLGAGRQAQAANLTMFEETRAQKALAAIAQKAGHKLRVFSIDIKPEVLIAIVQNPAKLDDTETWQVSRGVFGALSSDTVQQVKSPPPSMFSSTLEESLFDLTPEDLALVAKLAASALSRARLQDPGAVTEMELRRKLVIVPRSGAGDVGWQIHVANRLETAEIYADLAGKITFTDLSQTLRAKKLDLLAGGRDLDELTGQVRDEIKNLWVIRYMTIEKTGISFEAALATTPNAERLTVFAAGLNGIRTNPMAMPRGVLGGSEATLPLTIDEVDWSVLPKILQLARERAGLPDGTITNVVVVKPKRASGDSAVEWRISVKDPKAPLIWMPGSPPVREGMVVFDVKGTVLRSTFAGSPGGTTSLFDAATLTQTMAVIAERLGPHVMVSEVEIRQDRIEITAQDPKNPKRLAVYDYRRAELSRADDVRDARAIIANSDGSTADWLFDLAILQPAIPQLASLQQQTLTRLAIPNGRIDRITFSKQKIFEPQNTKVKIQISVEGDSHRIEWVFWDLSGKPVRADQAPSASGVPVVKPVNKADIDTCENAEQPARAVAACTRLIGNDTGHDRAVDYYNRGLANQKKGDIDGAIADYGEALKVDPDYARPYNNRAVLYNERKQFDQAVADLDAAVRIDANYRIAYGNRAVAHKGKSDWDGAIADYNELIRIDPSDLDPRHERGVAYFLKRDYDRAIEDLGEVIRREPKAAGSFTVRGRSYQAKGESDRAIADYTEAIRLTPSDAAPYIDRAAAYSNKGDFDGAIADYTQSMALDPKSLEAFYQRGYAYRRKGEFERAIADYNRAAQLDPKSAVVLLNRGYAYYMSGALPKALADISRSHELNPKEAYAAIWVDLVGQRSKLPSHMAEATAKVDMTAWPAPVIKLFLSQLTTEAALAAADDPDPVEQRGHVCEVNFYAGEIALLHGANDDAVRLFKLAAEDCPTDYTEREAAKAELKALGAAQ